MFRLDVQAQYDVMARDLEAIRMSLSERRHYLNCLTRENGLKDYEWYDRQGWIIGRLQSTRNVIREALKLSSDITLEQIFESAAFKEFGHECALEYIKDAKTPFEAYRKLIDVTEAMYQEMHPYKDLHGFNRACEEYEYLKWLECDALRNPLEKLKK